MTPAFHTGEPPLSPVVFIHATGTLAATEKWLGDLQEIGLDLYSHLPMEGCTTTVADMSRLGELLAELRELARERPVLFLRAPLAPGHRELTAVMRVLAQMSAGETLTVFSNASPELNPFAGLSTPRIAAGCQSDLVALLGQPRLYEAGAWPGHFLALSPATVEALAGSNVTPANITSCIQDLGGRLLVPGNVYMHDPAAAPFTRATLEPHETARPTAWGRLSERLHEWLVAGAKLPLEAADTARPATLHITHSWGGGVAAWIHTFISHDPNGRHFQLRAEGPQSGQGSGQRLALYAGNQLACAIDSWWLQPPIQAVDLANTQYREVLETVCRRFGIGRVMVSSLVGHSLDALTLDLPTVQILHDHFPAWPLISSHPALHGADLDSALADSMVRQEFPGKSAAAWHEVRERYQHILDERPVKLAAPSQSVVEVRHSLGSRWKSEPIEVITHGVEPLGGDVQVSPRPREDGRLRLVIPGRVQPGKGARLLAEALPELTRHAQVYLLGAGKGGEQFFGCAGVHVIPEYERRRLPELLAEIGPHLAALISVVPETFSFTLSEMTEMGIPVLATRVGSFEERISDGDNGWLVEPSPDALVQRLAQLAEEPEAIQRVRSRLGEVVSRSPAEMIADYESLCPVELRQPQASASGGMSLAQAQLASISDEALHRAARLEQARIEQASLKQEIGRRTRWAEQASRDLREEVRRRKAWVASLEADIEAEQAQLQDAITKLDAAYQHIDELQNQYDAVIQSRSWRLTRPLRAARRVAVNFMQARAWNPLRWPLLLAQFVRNLSTVGVQGTWLRIQRGGAGETPEPASSLAADPALERSLPDSVPRADNPVASIVIPAYNHLDVTAACLASIAGAESQTPYEVIVVDDASSDDTAEQLAAVDGLNLRCNEKNQGFIRSCNRGAAEARGEFLVILNNDTEVRDGWLDQLLAPFETHPDAGLVGARLVYPDGRLQECGGMVFRDGSGWNFGRGDDPDRPEYQYLRETDYCSGACIALRTEVFRELGGFDEHYAPAYYEDTDLAFRVRDKGLKVYVQPTATIIHHEGVSSGTDETSGTKRYQAINRKKFLDRWKDVLADHPPRIVDPDDGAEIRRARDHRLRGRVLVIDAYTPEPDQDSGSVRLVRLMRCLADLGYGVSFMAHNKAFAGSYTLDLRAAGIETWHAPWLNSRQAFFEAHGAAFDFIIISRHYVAVNYLALLRKHCPQARFIFDTVDLHYLREQRLAELEDSLALKQAAKQTRRSELSVIEAADATLVVSPVEQEVLSRDAPHEKVFLLSNIHLVNGSPVGFAERSDLFFVGGYQHPPNIDAACWFVNEIWPLVHEQIPQAKFHLIGSKAPDKVRELKGDGVVFHGFVEDLEPFLDRCRLAVAPLRYGAGVKGKVNHSMSHGQPVVATPAAVEGIHAEHEREILVAEDEQSFAGEVARLYQDEELWNRISAAAVENVRQHFSMDAARRNIEKVLTELAQP